MGDRQENRHDYHRRREVDERALASAAKDPRVAHSHIVMAERHRLFAIGELRGDWGTQSQSAEGIVSVALRRG